MAINSKQARRDAEEKRQRYFDNYMNRFTLLFHNSIVLKNEGDLPKRYLLRELLNKGGIAYHKKTGLYLPFISSQIDVYGLPKRYHLIGYDGFTLWATPEEVVILRANDICEPLSKYFEIQANKLVDIDMSIEQNLEAVKTMTIAEVPNQEALLSIANQMESRRIGATVVFVNKSGATMGTQINSQQTGATYLVDKLMETRREILNETLSSLGINVANVDKRERVQEAEVNSANSYAMDCINTLIDTFNYDAEKGGLEIRLEGNTTLIEDRMLEEDMNMEGEEENVDKL